MVFQNQEQRLLRNTSDPVDTRRHCNVTRRLYEDETSYRRLQWRCVSASQCSFNADWKTYWNLRISRVSWKNILHLKQNLIRKYQSEKIWNLSDIFFKETFVFLIFVSIQRRHDIPEALFFSLHSYKFFIEFNFFDFADILILRNTKKFSKSCFSPL